MQVPRRALANSSFALVHLRGIGADMSQNRAHPGRGSRKLRVAAVLVALASLAISAPVAAPAAVVTHQAPQAPSDRASELLTRAAVRWAQDRQAVGAASASSNDDPLLDTTVSGAPEIEPRGDIAGVAIDYGADLLRVSVTVPGGVEPTTSPNFQTGFTGIVAIYDVNGDTYPDFGSAFVGDGKGGILVATSDARGQVNPEAVGACPGDGRYDAPRRAYVLEIPAACIGNAYEVHVATYMIFDQKPGADERQLSFDAAPDQGRLVLNRTTTRDGAGYRFVASDGGIFSFGTAPFHGSTGGTQLNQPIVGMEVTSSGRGYWLVAADGGIFTFGDAGFFGSAGNHNLTAPIVGIAATPTGGGYWLAGADGSIFHFGDARFYGSARHDRLTSPVVSVKADPRGQGYYLLTEEGKVLGYGYALPLSLPTPRDAASVDIGVTPSGGGYWVARSDGSVSDLGDASPHGDLRGTPLARPIVGIAPTPTGQGYWLVGSDGGVFSFGDARFFGSAGAIRLNQPIVGMTA